MYASNYRPTFKLCHCGWKAFLLLGALLYVCNATFALKSTEGQSARRKCGRFHRFPPDSAITGIIRSRSMAILIGHRFRRPLSGCDPSSTNGVRRSPPILLRSSRAAVLHKLSGSLVNLRQWHSICFVKGFMWIAIRVFFWYSGKIAFGREPLPLKNRGGGGDLSDLFVCFPSFPVISVQVLGVLSSSRAPAPKRWIRWRRSSCRRDRLRP